MHHRNAITAVLVAAVVTLSACGAGDGSSADDTVRADSAPESTVADAAPATDIVDEPDATEPPTSDQLDTEVPTTESPTTEPPATEPAEASALDGFATVDAMSAPFAAYGERPVFSWSEVPGADSYQLWVKNADGTIYWAWTGTDTTIPLGGLPVLPVEAEGPDTASGMTWTVAALDADETLIGFGAADLEPS